jgi:hypothetical protein
MKIAAIDDYQKVRLSTAASPSKFLGSFGTVFWSIVTDALSEVAVI